MRLLVPASLAALTLTLAACGSSDAADPTTAPATQPTDTSTAGAASEAPVAGAPEGVVDLGELSQDHVGENVEYEQTPPVGGAHFPVWQTCDFYDSPVPNEQAVHSLEHGAVWITFAPDLAADQVAVIESLADGTREVLASPYDGLPSPVVASAWGLQLQLDSALDPKLGQFVDFYENGPQTPEANTPCSGGES